jgi:DNA-binding LytR/AlgR family response regulator
MRRLKVVLIEDETVAADRLAKMLHEVSPEIEILARLDSIESSVQWLRTHTADLLFLDIQLSDGICFSIFEQVVINTPVIFTTAYDQYTIRAFKLNSIAYLLKPIRKDDLEESLAKYQSLKSAFTLDIERLLDNLQGKEPEYKKRFLITYGERIRKVEVHEIAWFYAMEKSVFLKTFNDQSYPVDYTLDRLESMVDPSKFFRINRRFLISLDAIVNMTTWSRSRIKVELKPPVGGDEDAVVSIDRAVAFRKWLNT